MKTILITGGTGIVGQALIPAFVGQGYEVVFTSRKQTAIDGATCVPANFLETDGLNNFLKALDEKQLKITHLINNFRDADNLATDEKARPNKQQWETEYNAAVITPYLLACALADRNMLENVINVTSIYGITATNLNLYDGNQKAAPIHYNVAKAAEIHLTKEMAIRFANQAIRVNALAYGGVKGRADKNFEEKYAQMCPFEGMLERSDLAGAALFLADNAQSAKITGQTLQVDGGWTLW